MTHSYDRTLTYTHIHTQLMNRMLALELTHTTPTPATTNNKRSSTTTAKTNKNNSNKVSYFSELKIGSNTSIIPVGETIKLCINAKQITKTATTTGGSGGGGKGARSSSSSGSSGNNSTFFATIKAFAVDEHLPSDVVSLLTIYVILLLTYYPSATIYTMRPFYSYLHITHIPYYTTLSCRPATTAPSGSYTPGSQKNCTGQRTSR